MNVPRVRDLILYVLLVASEEADKYNRQLGQIHILKYLYLADLAWAAKNDGATWTGISWRFYHFGPWDEEACDTIEPTVRRGGGDVNKFEYAGSDTEGVQYSLAGAELMTRVKGAIPIQLRSVVKDLVKKFGKDTSALLHEVYLTPPILSAAPGEKLDFSTAVEQSTERAQDAAPRVPLTIKESRRRREAIREAGDRVRRALEEEAAREAIAPSRHPPRYDEVWVEGVKWIDSLAGPAAPAGPIQVLVGEEVWHSVTRRSSRVP